MRTRAGGGGGFEVGTTWTNIPIPISDRCSQIFQADDGFDESVRDMISKLRLSADILEDQLDRNAEPRFLQNALRVMKPTLKWADDITVHQTRRTMPITNARGKNQPSSTNVIGYKYKE